MSEEIRRRFSVEFPRAIKKCELEYDRHYPKKGDSWKFMMEGELIRLYFISIKKHHRMGFGNEWYEQLVDVINLGLMVLERSEINVSKQREGPQHGS